MYIGFGRPYGNVWCWQCLLIAYSTCVLWTPSVAVQPALPSPTSALSCFVLFPPVLYPWKRDHEGAKWLKWPASSISMQNWHKWQQVLLAPYSTQVFRGRFMAGISCLSCLSAPASFSPAMSLSSCLSPPTPPTPAPVLVGGGGGGTRGHQDRLPLCLLSILFQKRKETKSGRSWRREENASMNSMLLSYG